MYQNTPSIKFWAEDDRPREKLRNKGRSALSDAELLAIILGSGTRNKSAVELAQEMLAKSNNNLYDFGKLSLTDMMQFSGIGEAKGLTVMAVMELGRRRANAEMPERIKVSTAKEVYHYVKSHFQDLDHEEFRVLALSRSNEVIANKLISTGGRSGTIADGKIIFKELLDSKASTGILLHNHPSGSLMPSPADISLTKHMVGFGKMIALPIVDHIIVSDRGFYSFADNGRM